MRYSIEPKDRIFVNGYGFLSWAKNMWNKYIQKRLDTAKKSTTDAIKPASKRAIQKTAEATCDVIGNKIADEITSVSKKFPKEFHSQNVDEIEIPKEMYISRKRQQIVDELKLV